MNALVTDAMVEAATLSVHRAIASHWMTIAQSLGGDQATYNALLESVARAALESAARPIAASTWDEGYRAATTDMQACIAALLADDKEQAR